MESGDIKNDQVKATSVKEGFDAWKGRLNGQSCWIPGKNSNTEYISVSFSSAKTIKAVATQGAPKQDCWVTSYTVQWQYADSLSSFRKVNILITEQQLCQLSINKLSISLCMEKQVKFWSNFFSHLSQFVF